MKRVLVVVGKSLGINAPFMAYLERKVLEELGEVDARFYLDRAERDLFLRLEEIVEEFHEIVIASDEGYHLVSKIISTLTEDNLELKEGQLIPSRAEAFGQGSYLVTYGHRRINVVQVHIGTQLPKISLSRPRERISFFLVDAQKPKYRELLTELESLYSLSINRTSFIEGLEWCSVDDFLHEQQGALTKALAFGFEGKILFGEDFSKIVVDALIKNHQKVTTIESCTGGLIASEITKHAGVSSIFDGGVVSYANEVKQMFGVQASTLAEYGAVSLQTVHEMLDGILKTMGADMAMAVSGIAGPTGGTPTKPVGTVYVGAKSRDGDTLIEKLSLHGDRNYIQQSSMLWAFKLLVKSNPKIFFNFSLKSLDN